MICKTLNGLVELASTDFDNEVDFDTAKSLCSSLGEDWRLPTRLELKYLKETQATFFKDACYWSDEGNYVCFFPLNKEKEKFRDHLKTGKLEKFGHTNFARAVRSV